MENTSVKSAEKKISTHDLPNLAKFLTGRIDAEDNATEWINCGIKSIIQALSILLNGAWDKNEENNDIKASELWCKISTQRLFHSLFRRTRQWIIFK